ncbi:UNVERIFIED_CONTAM: HNH endonuclease [Methylobacteriaceae bacterium AG10]|nr:HNH endonuclease [Methylobacteriaceae bacterium AG10]
MSKLPQRERIVIAERKTALLSPIYLSECFIYDPGTGSLTWKARPRRHFNTDRGFVNTNARQAGRIAGSFGSNGYLAVRIDQRLIYAHRIAWVICNGRDIPSGMVIDHVDRDKSNNRIGNLRLADRTLNSQNCSKKRGKIYPKGVFLDRSKSRFVVAVGHNRKSYSGGSFATVAEAEIAAIRLRRQLHGGGHEA